jgi:hypothetical protein
VKDEMNAKSGADDPQFNPNNIIPNFMQTATANTSSELSKTTSNILKAPNENTTTTIKKNIGSHEIEKEATFLSFEKNTQRRICTPSYIEEKIASLTAPPPGTRKNPPRNGRGDKLGRAESERIMGERWIETDEIGRTAEGEGIWAGF